MATNEKPLAIPDGPKICANCGYHKFDCSCSAPDYPEDRAPKTHAAIPWHIERQSEKATGWKGISIFSQSGLCVANMVMQLSDIEMFNAKFIVRACNTHDDLVAALQDAKDYIELILDSSGEHNGERKMLTRWKKLLGAANAKAA